MKKITIAVSFLAGSLALLLASNAQAETQYFDCKGVEVPKHTSYDGSPLPGSFTVRDNGKSFVVTGTKMNGYLASGPLVKKVPMQEAGLVVDMSPLDREENGYWGRMRMINAKAGDPVVFMAPVDGTHYKFVCDPFNARRNSNPK